MSEKETQPIPDHEIRNFVGRDWECSSKYVDVPWQRGKITRVAIKPRQNLIQIPDGRIFGDGSIEDYIQIYVAMYVQRTNKGNSTIEQAQIDDNGDEEPFFIMKKNDFLKSMKPNGNMYVMKSPNGFITNMIHAPGNNIVLPQPPRNLDSV